jgi:hypothetical protein
MSRVKQVAILDNDFILSSIVDVSDDDWVTSAEKKCVALPLNNDMKNRIGSYIYDFNTSQFVPLRMMGLVGKQAIEFSDAVVQTLKAIADHTGYKIPRELLNALKAMPGDE